jgi:NAD(P)-dependent dehydrogenase (short-subunit alcohol dehydrogenase family)
VEVGGSALVTGASRGIGRAIAIELASRGFNTVASMRDPGNANDFGSLADGRLSTARMDVTNPSSFVIPADLRVLVNNAGVDSEYLPVEHSNLADWRSLFETNVLGTVSVTAAAIPTLRSNRPAVVCNITSSSILASVPFYSAYRATKAAVSALGDTLRVELAPFGIRVVEIMPGPIDTDMFRLSTGEQVASRFTLYRRMSEVAAELRLEHADPMVSLPADAASLIVDAILDDDGPMRYGCDPLSIGFLDLWRGSDDEAMFSMTGRSLLDLVGSGATGGADGAAANQVSPE